MTGKEMGTFGTMQLIGFSICDRAIGLMSRVFTNGPVDWGSIPGEVIPKTQKIGT